MCVGGGEGYCSRKVLAASIKQRATRWWSSVRYFRIVPLAHQLGIGGLLMSALEWHHLLTSLQPCRRGNIVLGDHNYSIPLFSTIKFHRNGEIQCIWTGHWARRPGEYKVSSHRSAISRLEYWWGVLGWTAEEWTVGADNFWVFAGGYTLWRCPVPAWCQTCERSKI